MNRQAHGGDPKQPVQAVPKAYPQAGIRDMDAGTAGRPGAAGGPPAAGDARREKS